MNKTLHIKKLFDGLTNGELVVIDAWQIRIYLNNGYVFNLKSKDGSFCMDRNYDDVVRFLSSFGSMEFAVKDIDSILCD